MSVFKFACPVCGQHIQCDSSKSGAAMECPTCFRKMVVPQAPTGADSKLVLTASQVQSRPAPTFPAAGNAPGGRSSSRATTVFALALIAVACAAAGTVYAFREKIFKRAGEVLPAKTDGLEMRLANDTNWTLKLAERKFPETQAAGRINGREFAVERASVQGGVLNFRQGSRTPREVVVTIHLFARRGEDLAGQSISIDSSRTNAPKVMLRWKDDQEQPVTHTLHEGYALRLEFGPVTGSFLPGKILLCAPDDAKSWMAGTFVAEIRKPPVPRPPRTPNPPPGATAKP